MRLMVFRRDLRLHDNTALLLATESGAPVIPCFFLNPAQLDAKQNPYRGDSAVQFLFESLEDLSDQIREHNGALLLLYGEPEKLLAGLLQRHPITQVFVNADYTPFSIERDARLRSVCELHEVEFVQCHDVALHPPGTVLTDDGRPYTVFSFFKKKAMQMPVLHPRLLDSIRFSTLVEPSSLTISDLARFLPLRNSSLAMHGGRKHALAVLDDIGAFTQYPLLRDYPAVGKTTLLSAHLKFGSVSVREVFWRVCEIHGMTHGILTELYWRDFFIHIASRFPHVFSGAFHRKYDSLQWQHDERKFALWCEGKTGFPIVDAGMRELNTTGFMHNRVRMIVASFLVKDLLLDWHLGERYFAQRLIDYDPAVNNGNWQWAASTGCDAQPYFRIFNPWLQAKRFDPDCLYIKRWVPELSHLSAKAIHALETVRPLGIGEYPLPIVSHKEQSEKAKNLFKSVA